MSTGPGNNPKKDKGIKQQFNEHEKGWKGTKKAKADKLKADKKTTETTDNSISGSPRK